jgi:hypothetical protein
MFPGLFVTESPLKAAETLETFGAKSELMSAERLAEPRKPLSVWWGVAAAIPLLALNVGIWIGLVLAIISGVNGIISLFH